MPRAIVGGLKTDSWPYTQPDLAHTVEPRVLHRPLSAKVIVITEERRRRGTARSGRGARGLAAWRVAVVRSLHAVGKCERYFVQRSHTFVCWKHVVGTSLHAVVHRLIKPVQVEARHGGPVCASAECPPRSRFAPERRGGCPSSGRRFRQLWTDDDRALDSVKLRGWTLKAGPGRSWFAVAICATFAPQRRRDVQ